MSLPKRNLVLGADVVTQLLPHRRPFLMVDGIESYAPDGQHGPALRATRSISANEEVFAGHFPGLHLWPGVYTIEGLGQSCNLLYALLSLEEQDRAQGLSPGTVLDGLRALEQHFRLRGPAPALLAELQRAPLSRLGLSARVDVKLLQPVFAGERLLYEVRRSHVIDSMARFDVSATVDGRVVAEGTMTAALPPPTSISTPTPSSTTPTTKA